MLKKTETIPFLFRVGVFITACCSFFPALSFSEPYSYSVDFGTAMPQVRKIGSGYVLNFEGITDEKTYEGKRSLKLDVTLKPGYSHLGYVIVVPAVPAEGRLKCSGRILVEEGSTGTAGIGVFVNLGPVNSGGGWIFSNSGPPHGEWKLIEGDPVAYADSLSKSNSVWLTEPCNYSRFLTGINIEVQGYGMNTKHVVVYVSDLKIEGDAPVLAEYRAQMASRWQPVLDRTGEKLLSWEKKAGELGKRAESLLSGEKKKRFEEEAGILRKRIDLLQRKGTITPSDARETMKSLDTLELYILKEESVND